MHLSPLLVVASHGEIYACVTDIPRYPPEVLPALAESARRGPGRPKLDKTLEAVTLRLDPAIVGRFRAQGADWRKQMARLLEKAAS
jgi:uncharacterized protein (DUF4415 family)